MSIETIELEMFPSRLHCGHPYRNHKAYKGRGEWEEEGMEVGEKGEYITIATLSPPE